MRDWRTFWQDESGSVVSAEVATIGAVVAVGGVVGYQETSSALNDEMKEVHQALRKLNQSYSYQGWQGCTARTASSSYIDERAGGLPETKSKPGGSKSARPQPEPPKKKGASSVPRSNLPQSSEFDPSSLSAADELPFDDDEPVTAASEKL